MKSKIVQFCIMSIMLGVSSNSYAVHSCLGKITDIQIAANGRVHISTTTTGNSNAICNLVYYDYVHPAACKAMFDSLVVAKKDGSDVRLFFKNDTNTDCNKGDWKFLNRPENGQFFHLAIY